MSFPMSLPGRSMGVIRQHAGADIIRRGRAYLDEGAVRFVVRRGNQLSAEVEGSEPDPYQVRVTLGPSGPVAACTSAYHWGGWCKHIVAVRLLALEQPGEVTERPTIAELIADLDAEALRQTVIAASEREPRPAEAIEG